MCGRKFVGDTGRTLRSGTKRMRTAVNMCGTKFVGDTGRTLRSGTKRMQTAVNVVIPTTVQWEQDRSLLAHFGVFY